MTIVCFTPVDSLSLLLLAILLCSSSASIRVVDLGKEYQSRPDKYVGLQMKTGVEYGARLQRIHRDNDQHLCRGEEWNVTVPDDGRPVALLVKKGLCSNARKAEVASRNIHPPGTVRILIIDGELRLTEDIFFDEGGSDDEKLKFDFNFDKQNDALRDKNPVTNSSHEFPVYDNWSDESTLTLRRRHTKDISVTILYVSYRTGHELLDIILNEEPDVQTKGGTVVTVDGVAPPLNRAVVVVWFLVSVSVTLLACICFANRIQELLEFDEPEPEPPHRPRRRRLTIDQVEQVPIGVFGGSQLVYNEVIVNTGESDEDTPQLIKNRFIQPTNHSLDACTICLDEYEIGDKLRCLPCRHAFHADCIAKWLIERSATCPLCKMDLYYEDDDCEVQHQDDIQRSQGESPNISHSAGVSRTTVRTESTRGNWWRNIFRSTEERSRVTEAMLEPLLREQEREQFETERSEADP